MSTRKTIWLSVFISLSACQQAKKPSTEDTTAQKQDYNTIKQLDWLEGTWKNESQQGRAIETWSRQNDSVLSGKSFFIIGKDTVSSESIRIEQHHQELLYIPVVKGQNDNKPVSFRLVQSGDNQWIFENLKHDFPNKISYTRIGQDSLLAEISGTIDGKASSQQFPMGRQK
jgi:hypothetical protein